MDLIVAPLRALVILVSFACGVYVGRCDTMETDVRNQMTAQEVHAEPSR